MSQVRLRRLRADHERIRLAFAESDIVSITKVEGEPPERYEVEYRLKGLRLDPKTGKPIPALTHTAEIYLAAGYPRQAPQCRMLTPVFHPNVDPHAICVGDHWAAGESLAEIVVRIGEIIAFQSYNTKSPLNGEAARWADQNVARLPIDARPIAPPGLAEALAAPVVAAAAPPPLPGPRVPSSQNQRKVDSRPPSTSRGPQNQQKVDSGGGAAVGAVGAVGAVAGAAAGAARAGAAGCANCGSPNVLAGEQACAAGHATCADCAIACALCGAGRCVLCGLKTCATCRGPVCEECAYACPLCAHPTCKAHARACQGCATTACSDCVCDCPGCERSLCVAHLKACKVCKQGFCEACAGRPMRFSCVWCGQEGSAREVHAGARAKCPHCNGVNQVPHKHAPPPARARDVPAS